MIKTMAKIGVSLALLLTLDSTGWAGCDPCLCGNGGGAPPPTDCSYGPFASHRIMHGAGCFKLPDGTVTCGY